MPGATNPMMSSGMNMPRKLLKMELNVRNTRTAHPGKKNEQTMPSAMAIRILGRSPIFLMFIVLFREVRLNTCFD